jgi:hypothetical protein
LEAILSSVLGIPAEYVSAFIKLGAIAAACRFGIWAGRLVVRRDAQHGWILEHEQWLSGDIGFKPDYVLETGRCLTRDEAEEIRREWQQLHQGPIEPGPVSVLGRRLNVRALK